MAAQYIVKKRWAGCINQVKRSWIYGRWETVDRFDDYNLALVALKRWRNYQFAVFYHGRRAAWIDMVTAKIQFRQTPLFQTFERS